MLKEVGHRTCQGHVSLENGKEVTVYSSHSQTIQDRDRQAGNRLAKAKICLRISGDPFGSSFL